MKRRQQELPAEVGEIGCQIERWRSSREKHTAMPAELWTAAAQLAQRHGINRICQALRLSYESLKKWVLQLRRDESATPSSRTGFVELSQMGFVQSPEVGDLEVEVCGRDGERMMIRLKGRSDVDVRSMVEGFWRRGR